MRKTTDDEKRDLALKANAKPTRKGNPGTRPEYIYSPEEIVNQYREYLRKEALARYEDDDNVSNRHRKMVSDMIADLGAEQLEYHMPALIFFFRRYMTQH